MLAASGCAAFVVFGMLIVAARMRLPPEVVALLPVPTLTASYTPLPATATPELAAQAVAAGFDCLDSWAVDFDPAPDGPFRCHWQAWRTRRERGLPTESDCCFVPAGPAPRAPRVRVRDVFGGETDAVVAGGAAATDPWWAAGAPPAGGSES